MSERGLIVKQIQEMLALSPTFDPFSLFFHWQRRFKYYQRGQPITNLHHAKPVPSLLYGERLVWKPLITGARSTARPGIATVWKFVNRCPFVLTSHQVLAEQ